MIRSLDFPGIYLPADSIQFASEAFSSLAHHAVQPQPVRLKGFLLPAGRAPLFFPKRKILSASSAGSEDIKRHHHRLHLRDLGNPRPPGQRPQYRHDLCGLRPRLRRDENCRPQRAGIGRHRDAIASPLVRRSYATAARAEPCTRRGGASRTEVRKLCLLPQHSLRRGLAFHLPHPSSRVRGT